MSGGTRELHALLPGGCALRCAVCDCRDTPRGLGPDGVPQEVRSGGALVVLRGNASASPAFEKTLAAAREAHWSDIRIRVNGSDVTRPDVARRWRDLGVRSVLVPMFSHVPRIHDRIAGRDGALVDVLRAVRAAVDAGLAVHVESPVLPPPMQSLPELLVLARRAAPHVSSYRLYVAPVAATSTTLAPPTWDSLQGALAAFVSSCRDGRTSVEFRDLDGIPFCALGHHPTSARLYSFHPTRARPPRSGFRREGPCVQCAVRAQCPGLSEAYLSAHGVQGVRPFTQRPSTLYDQRTTPRRTWDATQVAAARMIDTTVLRPTVNCNQDCWFCSANETSNDVLTSPDRMVRRIARLARRGIRWLSFGGGEPTLDRRLPDYVQVARRCGIKDVEVITNGALPDAEARADALADAGLTSAFVSLHAHDETLSRLLTNKAGDWERTLRTVDRFRARRVRVRLNHVVSEHNYRYLPAFANMVAQRWPDGVEVSFAFVTPQFKALEHMDRIPRISDVMPYLRQALERFVEARIWFVIGARQGIPPCFLDEFQAWSDLAQTYPNMLSEDAPQKQRGPACDACRYGPYCTGLWKPYAARYGLGELRPVEGPTVTREEFALLGFDTQRTLDDVPLPFRAPSGASRFPAPPPAPAPSLPSRGRALPLLDPRDPSERPLRIALLGTGRHAERLARGMRASNGLVLAGVASPHVLERPVGAFGDVPRFAEAASLLDAVAPDAVVVASATVVHHELASLALERGVPVLVEKPLTQRPEQADDLVSRASGGAFVMAAHNMLFGPGMRAFRDARHEDPFAVRRVAFVRAAPAGSPDQPAAWSREPLYQSLYHAVYVAGAAAGGARAEVVRVDATGEARPEFVRAVLRFESGVEGEIVFDFRGGEDRVQLDAWGGAGRHLGFSRTGALESLVRRTVAGEREVSLAPASDTEAMLVAFAAAVRARRPSPVPASEGRDTMATARAIVQALSNWLQRPDAPRHAASAAFRF